MDKNFARFWAVTLREEGGDHLSLDPNDRGNWTGGEIDKGELRGTKYGISAAAFPDVDIANLTLDHATGLAYARYFLPMCCDKMPPALGILVFDAAFNNGEGAATKMLQGTISVKVDGDLGSVTQRAIEAIQPSATKFLCVRFQAARMRHIAGGESWAHYSQDLSERLFRLFWQAQAIASEAAAGGVPAST